MGYTTEFTGHIKLSRPLTLSEAKEWFDLVNLADDDRRAFKEKTGVDTYLKWVPTESLDAVVWDGSEKFYEYVPMLEWICGTWLKERGIAANGELFWSGESSGDVGSITVANNCVAKHPNFYDFTPGGKPLTAKRLGAMALEALTQKAA